MKDLRQKKGGGECFTKKLLINLRRTQRLLNCFACVLAFNLRNDWLKVVKFREEEKKGC